MLDPSRTVTLAALPQLTIYADDETAARFYVIPQIPRIAHDEGGAPLISLLLYGRGQGVQRQLLGGMFSLTTDLALTLAERSLLDEGLRAHLFNTGAPCTTPNEQPTPEVVSPDWLDGTVEVQLTPTLKANGTPSLLGDNRCTVSLNLTADSAQAIQKAWQDGLPAAAITYQGHISAVQQEQTAASLSDSRKTGQPGQQAQRTNQIDIRLERTTAIRHQLTLSGPLALAPQDQHDRLQIINL